MSAQPCDSRAEFPVTSSQTVYRGKVFSLQADQVDFGGAQPVTREYLRHPGAVAIVAQRQFEGREQIMMIRQYRHPVGMNLWEIPAGLLDKPGEDYLEAAQRELAEEADLRAEEWLVLLDYFTSPGCSSESLRVFLARQCTEIPPAERTFVREDEEAQMLGQWVDFDQALEGVLQGRIHNPSACVGILALAAAKAGNYENLRGPHAPFERGR